jgi:hypothetical protein
MLIFNNVNSESEWSRKWTAELRRCNADVLSIVASEKQNPGWPDRYIHHIFFSGFIEVKRLERDKLQLNQELQIKSLNLKHPASAFVLWLDDFKPCYLQWFRKASNDWPYRLINDVSQTIELLRLVGDIQKQERQCFASASA